MFAVTDNEVIVSVYDERERTNKLIKIHYVKRMEKINPPPVAGAHEVPVQKFQFSIIKGGKFFGPSIEFATIEELMDTFKSK